VTKERSCRNYGRLFHNREAAVLLFGESFTGLPYNIPIKNTSCESCLSLKGVRIAAAFRFCTIFIFIIEQTN